MKATQDDPVAERPASRARGGADGSVTETPAPKRAARTPRKTPAESPGEAPSGSPGATGTPPVSVDTAQARILAFAKKAALALVLFGAWLHLLFFVVTMPLVLFCKYFDPPVTGIMLYRSVVWHWKNEPIRFVPLEKIPFRFRSMAVRVEDGSFMTHRGILLPALKNAWRLNRDIGTPMYGGSTITMQTARTLFLNPEKSYVRKYLEILVALEMEWVMGKDRILELYMNYAEWGKGVYGMPGAAWHYWKANIGGLSTDRAVRLVTLLSSPIKYTPDTISKSAILKQRYAYLVKRFE